MESLIFSGTAITVDVDQLWRGLLTLAGVVLIVSFALLILKIAGMGKRINHLIDEVSPPLKEVVDMLPQTVTHLSNITGNLEDLSNEVGTTIPVLLSDVRDVSETSVAMVGTVADLFTETTELLTSLLHFLQKPLATVGQVSKILGQVSKGASVAKRFKRKKKR